MIHMIRVVSLVNEGERSGHRKICAWCNQIIREGGGPISHGICPDCAEKEMTRFWEGKGLMRVEDPPGFDVCPQTVPRDH
jgi:RNA polymerase subunit RPABC4/transcription elongation factor Spt4